MAGRVLMPIGDGVGSAERFEMGNHFERAAQYNHGGQSLARLAERGGLSWCEAAAIIEMRPWFAMNKDRAEQIVRATLSRGDHP